MFTLGDKPLLPGELSIENHYRRLNCSRELLTLFLTFAFHINGSVKTLLLCLLARAGCLALLSESCCD